MPEPVIIVDYDRNWPKSFKGLRELVRAALGNLALAIEHVGSTSIVGVPAKPIIDLDVVVASSADVSLAIERLAALGYVHQGDLGVAGREAFRPPQHLIRHHLYLCPLGNEEYLRHISFRDYLRAHPEEAWAYGELKKRAAAELRDDREAYTRAKSAFIEGVLRCARRDADCALSPTGPIA